MFGMDHGIDMLGDNDQEEEFNEIVEGKKYGWAYVYSTAKLNPHNKVPRPLGFKVTSLPKAKRSECTSANLMSVIKAKFCRRKVNRENG